ncbi:MAG: ROK family protein [Chloroflexi bacterium]|nr:ROK family protein [Chloroflexota bacterium]
MRDTREQPVGLWIGIDVGGTKIDAVLVDRTARIVADRNTLTGAVDGEAAVMDRIAGLVRELAAEAGDLPIHGMGLGCPGQVNPAAGVVRAAVNLGWFNVALRAGLQERLQGVPGADSIVLANDVNALALGEYRFGLGRGANDLVYLALGTGLGGGAIVNGQIVGGDNDFAMEVGHMSLRPNGRRCGCGMLGCPEAYASGTGMLTGVTERLRDFPGSQLAGEKTLTTPHILTAARAGDALARQVVDEAAEMLGIVMTICATILNPNLFVIGGGLGRAAADLLLPRAEEVFRARVLFPGSERASIQMASVERAAVGAASLTM